MSNLLISWEKRQHVFQLFEFLEIATEDVML